MLPQNRIDYVDVAGKGLTGIESHPLVTGFPAPLPDVSGNSWTSDHAAVVTTFKVAKVSPRGKVRSDAPGLEN